MAAVLRLVEQMSPKSPLACADSLERAIQDERPTHRQIWKRNSRRPKAATVCRGGHRLGDLLRAVLRDDSVDAAAADRLLAASAPRRRRSEARGVEELTCGVSTFYKARLEESRS